MNHGDHSSHEGMQGHSSMDHSSMDHSGHNMMATTGAPSAMDHMSHDSMPAASMGGHDMMGMKMFFHFDLGDTVLFEGWKMETTVSTLGACLVFFLLAAFYEGLKCYREYLLKRGISQRRYPVAVISGESLSHACENVTEPFPNGANNRRTNVSKMFSKAHIIQSTLHILQVATSYALMLGFMTFNGFLCISILVGAGFGYFIFCWRKCTVVDVTEHCH